MQFEKDFLENFFNNHSFKRWLISRRWFADKLLLRDLNYYIKIEYFRALSKHLILLSIKVLSNEYSKSYFFPIVCLTNLNEMPNVIEEKFENIKNIENHLFENEIIIIEAEFFLLFWKEILKNLDIDVVFKNPKNFIFSLEQLGNDNTTNLLFSLQIKNKTVSKKSMRIYALKSYKNYVENLEIKKLTILSENNFHNIPKILGTLKVKDINVIGIMEIVQNKGNIGNIYWNELNELFYNYNQQQERKKSLLTNKKIHDRLISNNCIESIKIASQIGNVMVSFWKCLIKPDDEDYSFADLPFFEFFNNHEKKIDLVSSCIIENLGKLDYTIFSNQFEISEIIKDIAKVIRFNHNLKSSYKEKTLKIQPIHQDLHMEQILYDKINDNYKFYILDLEGDPQLSIKERKLKYPIEKDMAYFLRSLSYIKYNTLLKYMKNKENLKLLFLSNNPDSLLKANLSILDAWQLYLTQIILEKINTNKILMELFTIERILNEINYELQYRPNNLIVPILGLHEFITKHHL